MEGAFHTFPPPSGATPSSIITNSSATCGDKNCTRSCSSISGGPTLVVISSTSWRGCDFQEERLQTQSPNFFLLIEDLGPFKQWALDVVRPMCETKRGKWLLITAIDNATRWPVAWADTKHTAKYVDRFISLKSSYASASENVLPLKVVTRWSLNPSMYIKPANTPTTSSPPRTTPG